MKREGFSMNLRIMMVIVIVFILILMIYQVLEGRIAFLSSTGNQTINGSIAGVK